MSEMRADPQGVAILDVGDPVFDVLPGMTGGKWATEAALCGRDVFVCVPTDEPDAAMARVVAGTRLYQWAGVRVVQEHVGDVTKRFLAIAGAA